MQSPSRFASRIQAHFAATSVALASAGAAAEVVIWDAYLNIPNTFEGVYINVPSRISSSSWSPGWTFNPYGTTGLSWYSALGTGMMRYPGSTGTTAGNLRPGTVVGPSGNFSGSFSDEAVVVGTEPGNWTLNSTNRFGFKMVVGSATHYGWGKVVLADSINGPTRRITQIAWETAPGAPIQVPCEASSPPAAEAWTSTWTSSVTYTWNIAGAPAAPQGALLGVRAKGASSGFPKIRVRADGLLVGLFDIGPLGDCFPPVTEGTERLIPIPAAIYNFAASDGSIALQWEVLDLLPCSSIPFAPPPSNLIALTLWTTESDCNGNSQFDSCDLVSGTADVNGDGIPDSCQQGSPDINGDGAVNGTDLAVLLAAWGSSSGTADINRDGIVNGVDLSTLLAAWS